MSPERLAEVWHALDLWQQRLDNQATIMGITK